MLLNVLNNLTEATKASDGNKKKRVAKFDVEMMKMVLPFAWIWNVVYCLRMCMHS